MLFKHMMLFGLCFFAADGAGGGSASGDSGEGGESGDKGDEGAGKEGEGEGDEGADELSGLKSALEKERKAARDATRQLRDIQKKLDDIENAGKPESEKLVRERDDAIQRAEAAEQRIRSANARTAVYEAVGTAASPRAVFALIKDDLEFDEDDQPTNVDELIAREKKADPGLFRAAAGRGDGGHRGGTAPDVKPGVDRIRQAYSDKKA